MNVVTVTKVRPKTTVIFRCFAADRLRAALAGGRGVDQGALMGQNAGRIRLAGANLL